MAFLKGLDVGRIKESFESGIKAAQEGISSISVDDVIKGARDAAATGASTVGKVIDGVRKNDAETEEETPSYRELVSLLWCLAYVDGVISDEEKTTLADLSSSIDEKYSSYSEELEAELGARFLEVGMELDHRSVVTIEAQKLVESLELTPIDAKLLCWNLFALANSDGLDESELYLIKTVSENVGVEPATIEEFRNYSDSLIEIEKSIEQLKQSDKSYGDIEPIVSEFAKRERNIIEAAQSLISDR